MTAPRCDGVIPTTAFSRPLDTTSRRSPRCHEFSCPRQVLRQRLKAANDRRGCSVGCLGSASTANARRRDCQQAFRSTGRDRAGSPEKVLQPTVRATYGSCLPVSATAVEMAACRIRGSDIGPAGIRSPLVERFHTSGHPRASISSQLVRPVCAGSSRSRLRPDAPEWAKVSTGAPTTVRQRASFAPCRRRNRTVCVVLSTARCDELPGARLSDLQRASTAPGQTCAQDAAQKSPGCVPRTQFRATRCFSGASYLGVPL